ncbi:lysophospholipid acyltransferase family protein [Paracoccus sp. Z330]|uniref:Lysophospholipid acyltransferase family protein n=1 Tax=Paracoccus onchidii TaxID=3017813 RepID=A0ABT4ZBN9_9RHOB|nr:lysophospholipid acyltransferase family protein [Paracoccus onchidii]MDB6176781.1 lysophospholipid acyltransferase family protein [Paracoccus onchidii]
MSNRSNRQTPGSLGPWQYFQNILYYLNCAIATLVIGIVGLPLVALRGRRAANSVATFWIGYMLWAARVHLGVTCEVRGTPPTQDCIIAAKHQCFLDILVIAHAVPRRAFIMKKEVMRVPVMGWYAYKVGCIPIDRARGRDALRAISDQVQQRRETPEGLGQLIIYPEGTRSRPGEKLPYKHGVGTLRAATALPVVPVAVNAGLFWPRKGWGVRPGRAIVEFLPPVDSTMPTRQFMAHLQDEIETNSDRLMAEAGFPAQTN